MPEAPTESEATTMTPAEMEEKNMKALAFIEEVTANADDVQQRVLADILTDNASVEYLQRHGLHGRTDRPSFKTTLLVIKYEDIAPEINRIANGDSSPYPLLQPNLQVPHQLGDFRRRDEAYADNRRGARQKDAPIQPSNAGDESARPLEKGKGMYADNEPAPGSQPPPQPHISLDLDPYLGDGNRGEINEDGDGNRGEINEDGGEFTAPAAQRGIIPVMVMFHPPFGNDPIKESFGVLLSCVLHPNKTTLLVFLSLISYAIGYAAVFSRAYIGDTLPRFAKPLQEIATHAFNAAVCGLFASLLPPFLGCIVWLSLFAISVAARLRFSTA